MRHLPKYGIKEVSMLLHLLTNDMTLSSTTWRRGGRRSRGEDRLFPQLRKGLFPWLSSILVKAVRNDYLCYYLLVFVVVVFP